MATVVKRQPGESEDKLIAKFRKKVATEKLLTEIKELRYYKSPSEEKKLRLASKRSNQKSRRRRIK